MMKKFGNSALAFAVLNTCFALSAAGQSPAPPDFFKTVFFTEKKKDMSFSEFDRYQMQRHVPLVLDIPGLLGYSVNIATQPDDAPFCSLFVELWFESGDAFQKAMESEEAATAIADQPNMLEQQATFVAVKEYLLKAPPARKYMEEPGLYKATFLAKKKPSMSRDEYLDYQMNTHAPLVLAIPGLKGYEVGIIQHEVSENEYDAVVHIWFDDEAAFRAGMSSPEAERAIADQANFLEKEELLMMVVDERMIRVPEGAAQ